MMVPRARHGQVFALAFGLFLLVLLHLLFHDLGRPELTRPTAAGVVAIVGAVWASWDRRRRRWFWVAIAAIAAVHAGLIIWVPWPAGWIPFAIMLPIVIADVTVILVILALVERRYDGTTGGKG